VVGDVGDGLGVINDIKVDRSECEIVFDIIYIIAGVNMNTISCVGRLFINNDGDECRGVCWYQKF
jgi:hypothetical protein